MLHKTVTYLHMEVNVGPLQRKVELCSESLNEEC